VFVTGTFDQWSKSIKLEKQDSVLEKTVTLPKTDEKILYKVSMIVSIARWAEVKHGPAHILQFATA
jgi:hypothetical protein